MVPTDVTLEFINSFSSEKQYKFQPDLLNSRDEKVREPHVKVLRNLFRHIALFSNQNLERNVMYLNTKENRSSDEMEWTTNRFNNSKFKLTY